MFRLHIDCPSWARFWFFETLNSVICLRIRLRKIPHNIHTQALSWFKKGGPHSHNCYFLCWNDASLWVNNTAYNYIPALHIFWEPVLKKHILSSFFFFFLTSIKEITTWGEGLWKHDVCIIVLAPDYKGNLTTVNSLWKSFLIQPTKHQVHQVQNVRIKGDLTSLLVCFWLCLY